MTGLLDTHTALWMDHDSAKLSPAAAQFIADPGNEVLLSVVSIWEIAIKTQLGKLAIPDPVPTFVNRQVANGVRVLGVELAHVLAVLGLPSVHKDPFDRLLVAQAITEGAVLVTADAVFAHYPVTAVW